MTKNLSLTMKVWIRSFTNEEGYVCKTYTKTRSVDSCKMIKCSLHELAQNLTVAKIKNLINHFASRPEEDKSLIGQKCTSPVHILTAMHDTQNMDNLHGTSGPTRCKKLHLVSAKRKLTSINSVHSFRLSDFERKQCFVSND